MDTENKDIFSELQIKNYKSIRDLTMSLGRINVLIGSNGSGKSNILEAIAFLAAVRGLNVKISDLQQIGVRITKPALMRNSFFGVKSDKIIALRLKNSLYENDIHFLCEKEDIFSDWIRAEENNINAEKKAALILLDTLGAYKNYLIYCLNTQALRGMSNDSKLLPLGINGEGLDVLLSTFSQEEWAKLNKYSYFIEWLEEISIDQDDKLKYKGHKLGRSSSLLYFKDKFMQKSNNVFSAENSNEGVLHVLFYLALFISKKTPTFFAIDNIESCLNPRICRELIKVLAQIAAETNKQAIITTHNPAILDGLNLHDENQALFVVKRSDEGYTKAERIRLKPQVDGEQLKLSELWMRGHLGGLPTNF
jgi:AAA15 family ATPase/GTPase